MANVMTPEFRVNYPAVFEAKFNKLKNKEEYSMVCLFSPKADLSKLKAAAEAALEEEFGKDRAKWPKKLNSPFKKQDDKADANGNLPNGYEKGGIYLQLSSKQKPGLVNANREAIIDPSEFYSGCYARATLSVYAYDHPSGQKGVNFSLQNIQKLRDGDPISGRPRAESEFEAVDTGTSDASGSSNADSLWD